MCCHSLQNDFIWRLCVPRYLPWHHGLKLLINLCPFAINGLGTVNQSFLAKGLDDRQQICSYEGDCGLLNIHWSKLTHKLHGQVIHFIRSMTSPQIYSWKGYHLKFEDLIINCKFSLTSYELIFSCNSMLPHQIIRLMGKSPVPMNNS